MKCLYGTSQRFCSVKAHKGALPTSIVADHVISVHLLFVVTFCLNILVFIILPPEIYLRGVF